jgi:hypothetical protein
MASIQHQEVSMSEASDLRLCKLQLNSGTGRTPALCFGTLIADPAATMLLAWAVQRGTAVLTTTKTAARAPENFNISALPEDALEAISQIQTRHRLNSVVSTGIPGFIPQGS